MTIKTDKISYVHKLYNNGNIEYIYRKIHNKQIKEKIVKQLNDLNQSTKQTVSHMLLQ